MLRREFVALLAGTWRLPKNAVRLFNGQDLANWTTRDGGPARWNVGDRYVEVAPGSGDIMTTARWSDFQLHIEFWLPFMPEARGQARANSGVYVQGRYEIQVLDSFGDPPGIDGCGAIYGYAAPLRNACRRPMRWQTYDVAFRSALGGDRSRITVFHNGVLIHDNYELPGISGGAVDTNEGTPGPLLLQDHGNAVRYRNAWILTSR